ncbi:MAG TPA: 2-oxo acid dehydrogenase subunit E2, partial [Gammaproteobacteria bacterium]|nr:2-oxo acid dehydrogenase subunit E2 [Gammaproteobacteria bacterium]
VHVFVKTQLAQTRGNTMLTPFSSLPSIDFSQFGPMEVQALSRIKKISGKNLQRNWMMIPHVTQFGEADITSLEEFRKSQKDELEKQQIKLTPLVFVMKAAVASLRAFPHFNASLDTSGEHLVMKKYFHIGIAVDTPDGLVVPVVRDVDKKGLVELAKELAQMSEKARNKQLTPAHMQGGCFSISSLGGIGGTSFTPIINYPEVAILGVSKASYKPVYEGGTFVPHLMLPLSLSYDHRVIDGADGARFMNHLTNMLSDIRNLLL